MNKLNKFKEHKDKILLMGTAGLLLLLTYYLVIIPYKNMKYSSRSKKETELRLKKVQKEFDNIEKVYEKRYKENKKAEAEYQQYEKYLLSKGFKNVAIFEEFIQQKLEKNYLQIKSISNIETSGMDRNEKGKVYIGYEIEGTEKNIKNFVKEIENSEKLVSLMDSSVLLEKKEEKSRGIFKVSGYLLNTASPKKDTYIIEEKIYISFSDLSISSFKIIKLNKKKYVVIRYKNGERKIIYQGEEIEIGAENYTVEINDNGIYLKHREKK